MSNDTENPRFFLTLQGEIEVDVTAKPRGISFGQVPKGESMTREVELDVTHPDQVEITSVTIDNERFAVKRKSGSPEGDSVYEVELVAPKEVGRVIAQVKVAISGSEVDEVLIPVRATVVGDLSYPKNIYFGKGKNGFPEREVVFTSRSGKPVEIKSVEDPAGKLKVEVTEPKGKRAVLKASVSEPDADWSRPSRNVLEVSTSDPDEPEVEIRYTVADRSASRDRGLRIRKPIGGDMIKTPRRSDAKRAQGDRKEGPK